MTVIVFLIDTSASMMQKTYLGTTYLDFARLSVELFLKQRQRDPSSKQDRYMLMTFEEYPLNVKSGWKESQAVFTEQLKNLRANGVSNFKSSVESVLRFVNLNRMQTGIENYGYGRYPLYSEHVVIISITDGAGTSEKASFTNDKLMGSELTTEPFRWDQRLFSLVLRFPGHHPSHSLLQQPQPTSSTDESPIQTMCAMMGGRSFCINSHREINFCVETILQRIQYNGVLIRLEKYGPDPKLSTPLENNGNALLTNRISTSLGDEWKSQLVMLLKSNGRQGHWPIPEAFCIDTTITALPPRLPHPVVLFRCEAVEPVVVNDFPFDKYELENSHLTQYIIERKESNVCWQIFVENSGRLGSSKLGFPCGYLKTSTNFQNVSLFLMPYNYPLLLPLIEQAVNDPKFIHSSIFKIEMDKYLQTVPYYYHSALKKALKRVNIIIPFLEDSNKSIYNPSIMVLITKAKYIGKEEFEMACSMVAKILEANPPTLLNAPHFIRAEHCRITNPKKNKTEIRPCLKPFVSAIPQIFKDVKICMQDSHIIIPVPSTQFKNPFEIERRLVVTQLEKMRINFEQQVQTNSLHVLEGGMPGQKIKLQHAEDLHNQPIGKMGNYQEYVACLTNIGGAPLRELEPQSSRPHAFGNPFKLDKKSLAIDEVNEVNTSQNATINPNNNMNNVNENGKRVKNNHNANNIVQPNFTMTPRIRTKRKAGPLDTDSLNFWKKRRKTLLNTFSDTSSICSDISDLSSLNDNEENNLKIAESDYNINSDTDQSNGIASTSTNRNPFEQYLSESNFNSTHSKLNGMAELARSSYYGNKGKNSKNNHHYEPNSYSENSPSSWSKTNHNEFKNNNIAYSLNLSGNNNMSNSNPENNMFKDFEESQSRGFLSVPEMNNKKSEISVIIRTIGIKSIVYDRCIDVLKGLNQHDTKTLLDFAISQAQRFKRIALISQLNKKLKSLKPIF